MSRRAPFALALFACVLAAFAGLCCEHSAPEASARKARLVVFAASSLRDGFTRLGQRFEAAHPGAVLSFNFAGTQELRTQLEHGAQVDVFASADRRHMDELVVAGRVMEPVVFAQSELVMVVAKERSSTLTRFADLPSAARIVLGAEQVPVGGYTLRVLERANATLGADFRARVEARVVSRELSVRQVLSKVSLGDAEAGIVYRSDVRAARAGVGVVSIPPEVNVSAEFQIAVVRGAAQPELAQAWLDLVRSEHGKRELAAAGFAAVDVSGTRGTP